MTISNKHKTEFDALYEYMTASDYHTNFVSNFNTCVNIVSSLNVSNGPIYMIREKSTTASDSVYHMGIISKLDYITKIRFARKVHYNLQKSDQDNLWLAFSQSPGKFNFHTRQHFAVKCFDRFLNLSALAFSLSNYKTIAEFEKHIGSNKNELRDIKNNAVKVFESSFGNYVTTYNILKSKEI
jgi:hypothetical protein